ncbi:hypothetical protein [Taibaiella koreensis]|uniref:hypothetical protein n=1 Tax=Taibaiella koreensis TaxID=1268548 RepID=UPI0013C31B0E|nr:hypothetical protein [Taibaiella koreensis]
MKTLLRKSLIAASFVMTLAASAFPAMAQDNIPVYLKAANPSIGIAVANATGASFAIKDQKGNTVMQGTVKNDKTFFIPTSKLGKGTYRFVMGSLVLQEFIIK